MISPSDNDYKDAKLVKQGKKGLPSVFKELAIWVQKEFDVGVLNIYYDLITPDNRPRLNVILEFNQDENKFRKKPVEIITPKTEVGGRKSKNLLKRTLNEGSFIMNLLNEINCKVTNKQHMGDIKLI
jgi:hypothetical protein